MNWDNAYEIAPNHRLWAGPGMPLVLEFIRRVRPSGFEHILDAGCGDGRHLAEMVRNGFPLVVGCDGSWRPSRAATGGSRPKRLPWPTTWF